MIYLTPMGVPILTWAGLGWLALLFFTCGIVGSLIVPFVVNALDNTKGARARRALAIPAEAQRVIDRLYRERDESRIGEAEAKKENAQLRRLGQERIQGDRYWDSRARAVIAGKKQ